ncbi:CG10019, partial [Drosophila busckii]
MQLPHHCHATNPLRFPQAPSKRHCDNFGSYATLPANEQQQQQHAYACNRHCPAQSAAAPPPPPPPPAAAMSAHINPQCCYMYNPHYAAPPPPPPQLCLCDNWYQQQQHAQQQQQHATRSKPLVQNGGGCYFGYEGLHASHITDEEDSAFPALADREFHLLHRNIPALRRTGVDTTRIRQYFYPDGGWGWIICGVSFLVHILTTGLQLSYGLLSFYAVQHLHNTSGIELLGALSWSISMLVIPFVVSLCRKRSIRLLSIVGGLVMPLGILFTSFATEFGQVVFSYGIVFGIGVAMVREASTVMLGNYFKRRRQFVEMVAMSGEGVGIALFSVILKEGVGKAGWRLGLQIVAALMALSFFMGLMYRPASLYHPQRRAIQHLKNQRKKVRSGGGCHSQPKLREKKPIIAHELESSPTRYLFLDISSLRSVTVKILLMTSSVAALGIYTPMFLMALNAAKEGSDVQELVLLQTFLGISMALGVVIAGALLRRCFVIRQLVINTKIVAQLFIAIVALAILFLSFVMGYKSICVLSWLYGIGLGGFQYSLKILALERVKLKHFSKAWGFIRGVQSVPLLISVPLSSFLNDYSLKYGRAGYYICSAAAAIAGIIIFFISESQEQQQQQQQQHGGRAQLNGHLPTPMLTRHSSARQHRAPNLHVDFGYTDYPAPDLLSRSCMSLNQMEPYLAPAASYCPRRHMPQPLPQHQHQHHYHHHQQQQPHQSYSHAPTLPLACHNLQTQQSSRLPYQLGQGSIGAKMGKRLQRSLSFIQQHSNCCDGQMYCSWHSTYELGCRKSP